MTTDNTIKKVLFLDVDGVSCTRRASIVLDKEGATWNAWDPIACAAIEAACSEGGIQIVISSTWRYEQHRDMLFEKLKQHHLEPFIHLDWKTKDLSWEADVWNHPVRGMEIKEWLSRHPEVTSYRILDDMEQFLPEQSEYVIFTDTDEGMSSLNLLALLRWAGYRKS